MLYNKLVSPCGNLKAKSSKITIKKEKTKNRELISDYVRNTSSDRLRMRLRKSNTIMITTGE